MRSFLPLLALTALACSDPERFPIGPDSATGSGGNGAAGGGDVGGSNVGGDGVGGTGGEGLPALGYENGTRLRARVAVGEDGSRQFLGWRDTERDENCSFAEASDGTTRCMPAAPPTIYYSDSACAVPVMAHTASACELPLPDYARDTKATCNGVGQLRERLGPIVIPATVYFANGSNCLATPITANTTYYILSGPLEDDLFAAANEEIE